MEHSGVTPHEIHAAFDNSLRYFKRYPDKVALIPPATPEDIRTFAVDEPDVRFLTFTQNRILLSSQMFRWL